MLLMMVPVIAEYRSSYPTELSWFLIEVEMSFSGGKRPNFTGVCLYFCFIFFCCSPTHRALPLPKIKYRLLRREMDFIYILRSWLALVGEARFYMFGFAFVYGLIDAVVARRRRRRKKHRD